MEKKAQLIDLFRRLRESPQVLFTAEVKKVDGNTCTVEIHGLQIDGVRLMPTSVDADSQLLITPAVGSYVLVGDLSSGSHSNLCVLCTQTLATVDLTIQKTHLVVDKTGITYTDKTKGDLNLRIGQTGSSQSNDSEETFNLKVGDSNIVVKKDEVDLTLKSSALKVVDGEVDMTVGNSSMKMTKDGKIVLNGGKNKGLVFLDELVTEINNIVNDINMLKGFFSNWIPTPQDGGGALKGMMASWSQIRLQNANVAKLENTNITQ